MYPAFTPDPDGPEVTVQVLESAELPAHWDRLDAFEVEGYVRMPITVRRADDEVRAYIYRHSTDRSER